MNQPNDAWQPLPIDVAEWMGVADVEADASRCAMVVPLTAPGWRERLRVRLAG